MIEALQADGLLGPIVVIGTAASMVPALIVGFFFGGRGLLWALGFATIVAVLSLIWFFGLSGRCCPTGMEGLALVVVLGVLVVSALCAGVAYAVLAVVGLLPAQRERRLKE